MNMCKMTNRQPVPGGTDCTSHALSTPLVQALGCRGHLQKGMTQHAHQGPSMHTKDQDQSLVGRLKTDGYELRWTGKLAWEDPSP